MASSNDKTTTPQDNGGVGVGCPNEEVDGVGGGGGSSRRITVPPRGGPTEEEQQQQQQQRQPSQPIIPRQQEHQREDGCPTSSSGGGRIVGGVEDDEQNGPPNTRNDNDISSNDGGTMTENAGGGSDGITASAMAAPSETKVATAPAAAHPGAVAVDGLGGNTNGSSSSNGTDGGRRRERDDRRDRKDKFGADASSALAATTPSAAAAIINSSTITLVREEAQQQLPRPGAVAVRGSGGVRGRQPAGEGGYDEDGEEVGTTTATTATTTSTAAKRDARATKRRQMRGNNNDNNNDVDRRDIDIDNNNRGAAEQRQAFEKGIAPQAAAAAGVGGRSMNDEGGATNPSSLPVERRVDGFDSDVSRGGIVGKQVGTAEEGGGGGAEEESTPSAPVASTEPASSAAGTSTENYDSFLFDDAAGAYTPSPAAAGYGSSPYPMIEAELVTPPVEAYHVSIDEDHPTTYDGVPIVGVVSPFELEQREQRGGGEKGGSRWLRRRRFSLRCSILVAISIVVVTCSIVIPLTVIKVEESVGGNAAAGSSTEASPTSAPTFSYPCYTSTYEIVRIQMEEEETIPEAFVMCPNSVIEVGTFKDPAVNDFTFVDGDYPLMAVRENVVVQCGLDGRSTNNCTFDGGFIQVFTMEAIPLPDGSIFLFDWPIDNFTVRGITFTGQPINAGPYTGISLALSHPGKNIRFEDCVWKDFSAQNGLIAVFINPYQSATGATLEDNSVDVTFSDCTFERIVYDTPLIMVINQGIHIERTVFRDVKLSVLVAGECWIEAIDDSPQYEDGCAGLFYCGPGSVCSMEDICVYDFEYGGPSMVNVYESASFEFNGLFLNATQGTPVDEQREASEHSLGTWSNETCELTYVSEKDYTFSNCTDIFLEPTCHLGL
jgi:hypothetical protein